MTICYDNMIEHAVAEYDKLINYHIIFHYIMSHYVYHIVVIIISDLCRYYMTSLLVALLLLINICFYWIIMFLTARSPFRKKIEYHWIIALQSWIKFGYIGDHLGAGTYRLVRDMEVPHVVATPPWPFDKLQRALIERHPMQETESGLCWNKDWSLIFVWPFHWQFFLLESSRIHWPLGRLDRYYLGVNVLFKLFQTFQPLGLVRSLHLSPERITY